MSIMEVSPARSIHTCTISSGGTISFPHTVLNNLKWRCGMKVEVSYIISPFIFLFRKAQDSTVGFTLSANSHSQSGKLSGKITCTSFSRQILRTRVRLPLRSLAPLYLPRSPYELVLILEEPSWVTAEFSQAGCHTIPENLSGIYELLDGDKATIRIGEGSIAKRLRVHLKDARFADEVRFFRYFQLTDKEESEVVEQILLSRHTSAFGTLPIHNFIHS